jgi:LysR family glycine cleavage system transcriptional activator
VKIKVPPTFAMRWLIPRLERFRQREPTIEVRLTCGVGEVKLGKEPFDMGVVYVRRGEPGRKGDVLLVDRVIPVASRAYLDRAPRLDTAADLARHVLLLNNPSGWDWHRWGRAFEVDDLPPDDGLQLELVEAAIQAARSGQGVALVGARFVEAELASGRLIAPLPLAPLAIGSFVLIQARGVDDDPCVRAFRQWLLAEAAG